MVVYIRCDNQIFHSLSFLCLFPDFLSILVNIVDSIFDFFVHSISSFYVFTCSFFFTENIFICLIFIYPIQYMSKQTYIYEHITSLYIYIYIYDFLVYITCLTKKWHTHIYIYIYMCVCVCVCVCVISDMLYKLKRFRGKI